MMKSEFLNMTGINTTALNEKEYEKIETVYNYHPLIHDKTDIVRIYKDYGMKLIEDMLPRATEIARITSLIDEEKARHNRNMEQLNESLAKYE